MVLLGPDRYDPWQHSSARNLERRVGTVVVTTGQSQPERPIQLYADWLACWMREADLFVMWLPDINPEYDAWPLLEIGLALGSCRPCVVGAEQQSGHERVELLLTMAKATERPLSVIHKTLDATLMQAELVSQGIERKDPKWLAKGL
jgi:hypothetical protein